MDSFPIISDPFAEQRDRRAVHYGLTTTQSATPPPAPKRVRTPGMAKPAGRRAAGGKKNKRLKAVATRASDVRQYALIGEGIPANHKDRAVSLADVFAGAFRVI